MESKKQSTNYEDDFEDECINVNPILICADNDEEDNGRIYYVSADNRRHWIPSPEVANSYGWDLGRTIKMPINEIMDYPLSFSIAKKLTM